MLCFLSFPFVIFVLFVLSFYVLLFDVMLALFQQTTKKYHKNKKASNKERKTAMK